MKSEYLLFNLIILGAPIIGGLIYRKTVWPKPKPLLAAFLLVSVPFIIWDQWAADYFWIFNPAYTLGINIGKLPFEEILFFLIIPFACIFLWVNFKNKVAPKRLFPACWLWFIGGVFIALSIYFLNKSFIYSFQTSALLGILIAAGCLAKKPLTIEKNFLLFLIIVFSLTLIFNGYLTWRPVVIYNQEVKTNFLIGTVPIEDFFYGLILNGAFIWIYEKFPFNS